VYSNTVSLTITVKGSSVVSVYPTLFTNQVSVIVSNEQAQEVNIELYDNAGKIVATQTKKVSRGLNTIVFDDLARLSQGFYIIKVQMDNTIFTQKVIK